jgi:hypothetical protein
VASTQTRAILNVLRRGREEKIARSVMRVFGASSLDECLATYDAVGAAERATLDDAVQRMTADAGAVFWLSVDNEAS